MDYPLIRAHLLLLKLLHFEKFFVSALIRILLVIVDIAILSAIKLKIEKQNTDNNKKANASEIHGTDHKKKQTWRDSFYIYAWAHKIESHGECCHLFSHFVF